VDTPPVRKEYAIFDIAESRFFKAQNAPKSFVAELRAPPAAFDGPTSKREEGSGRKLEGRCYVPSMENSRYATDGGTI